MTSRVYVIISNDGLHTRLVRASHRSIAERHVSQQFFSSRIASKDDLELYLTDGIKVETAHEMVPPEQGHLDLDKTD